MEKFDYKLSFKDPKEEEGITREYQIDIIMEDGKPVVSAMRRIEGSNIEMEKFYSKEVVITELEKDKVKVENLNELVNRRKDEYLAKTGRIWIDV